MSSNNYSACLRPERQLRLLVLASGVAAAVIGSALILFFEVAAWARLAGGLAWLSLAGLEFARLLRGYRCVESIRVLPDCRVVLGITGGERVEGLLAGGSVVIRGWAWLRIRAADGLNYGELIRGNSRKNNDWRRLQVIWRHIGE